MDVCPIQSIIPRNACCSISRFSLTSLGSPKHWMRIGSAALFLLCIPSVASPFRKGRGWR